MTRRKENILILICTLVLVSLLTLWRASKLTMQEDTGPLPAGQRSMKPVELYIGPSVKNSIDNITTAFELAHGVQIKKSKLAITDTSSVELPELNSSVLVLLSKKYGSLLTETSATLTQTTIPIEQAASNIETDELILIHFPEEQADPNVTEVVNYLSATNQAHYLYSEDIE